MPEKKMVPADDAELVAMYNSLRDFVGGRDIKLVLPKYGIGANLDVDLPIMIYPLQTGNVAFTWIAFGKTRSAANKLSWQQQQQLDAERYAQAVSGRHPKLDRNIEIVKMLLDGESSASVAATLSVSYGVVKSVIESLTNAVVREIQRHNTTHPFTMEKYPHAYCEYGVGDHRLIPRWLRLDDLKAEKEFFLKQLLAIQAVVHQYREKKHEQA
jgi:DNA-binding CsgD family transcriptional regulator